MIKVFKQEGFWVTQQCPPCPNIFALFGTDIIPTPYKEGYDGKAVRDRIQSLNPDKEVVLIDSPTDEL